MKTIKKKKIITIIRLICLCALLANCTPARIVHDTANVKDITSRVTLIRENKILFLGVTAIFGYNNDDKIILENGQITNLQVPIGEHNFFVRSDQADQPFNLNIEVKEKESLCLIIKPNPKPLIKFIIPLFFYSSHTFTLDVQKTCN